MSKEQKTLKSCYILDRLREWFELYGNQNHQMAEEELQLAIDELYEYQQKDQRIIELEEQLKNAIVPKFNRQEHIYCVAFGEIREFVVVAYLDNNITLCEDTTTSKLEWCDNKFLVLTKEEAEAKLKELEEQDGNQ